MENKNTTTKLVKSFNYDVFSFLEFEKENKFKSYCFKKRHYDKEKKEFIDDFTISLNKISDLSIIKALIKEAKNELRVKPYAIMVINQDKTAFSLVKDYEVNGELKQQIFNFTGIEKIILLDFIERILANVIKPNTFNKNNKNNKEEVFVEDDDIPF